MSLTSLFKVSNMRTEVGLLYHCTGVILAGCLSCCHQWLIWVSVGVEPNLAGCKSIALTTDSRLLYLRLTLLNNVAHEVMSSSKPLQFCEIPGIVKFVILAYLRIDQHHHNPASCHHQHCQNHWQPHGLVNSRHFNNSITVTVAQLREAVEAAASGR